MPGDPSADRTYYENLLKGERNTDHYLTVAKEIYEQGYVEDAIAYLKKGIDQLRPSRFSEIVFLKENYEIGKIYIGADDHLAGEITKAASCDIDLLIEGETGTGKEIVAREIHSRSKRKLGPFVPISCATLVPTLLGSELFGHISGAFTDAKTSSPGIFKAANHGTVFLDELDSLDLHQQAALLRFLQEREIKPIGSQKIENVDVRVLCATNKNVLEMVNREMRADLYYRIGIFTISLLPLRDKKHIIPNLAYHFIEKHKPERQKLITVTQAAMELLQTHPWPGNIRELENLIRVVVTTTDTETITPDHLKF
jgi:transcriptional regulator with PAS, ATPase and Fis domain